MTPRRASGRVHDLPEALPEGEHVLWQGSPAWWPLARSLHLRLVAGYLGVWLAVYALLRLGRGGTLADFGLMAGGSVAAVGLFALYAVLVCRTTSYTITNRRLVLQAGIALPMSFNIPYARVQSVDLRRNGDGSGDLVLSVQFGKRLGYLAFWPHARPWRVAQPQPMFRAVGNVDRLVRLLSPLLQADPAMQAAEQPAPRFNPAPISAAA